MAKKKTPFKPYEGKKSNDRHVRITKDMMLSSAYKSLSPSAIVIYLSMKMWSAGNDTVDYAISVGLNTSIRSETTVKKSLRELMFKGFIEKVSFSTGGGHIPTTYRFSSRWSLSK